jgi:hypothetical protein
MPDDEWARIARELPGGFAGLFFDTRREPGVRPVQGPLVVMLADTSHHEETLAALAPRVAAMRGGRGPDVRGAIVRRARWDFAQLYDWSHYLMNTAWTRGEITSSDIDEVRNRIVYGVVDEGAKSRLEMGLAARDVPCELVIVEVSGPVGKSMIRRQPPDAR